MNIKINSLQHVGIPVTNLETSVAFYQKLGFSNAMTAKFDHNGAEGNATMMQLEDIIMEVYQMPEIELEAIRNRGNGHIDHVAFDVDDIDATFAMLKANSFKIMEPAPVFLQFWDKGCKYFNIIGPDGERLEFNEIIK